MQKYLEGKFGDAIEDVSSAMLDLAKSLPTSEVAIGELGYVLFSKGEAKLLFDVISRCLAPVGKGVFRRYNK